MADRVAVLEEGRIQQIGTPMEVYNSPANLFVAGFIGSPSMNLLPCQLVVDGDKVFVGLVGGLQLAVTDSEIARALTDSAGASYLVLGVHPEDVLVSHEEIPESTAVEVYSFEPLGAETIVELIIGKNEEGTDVILKARGASTLSAQIGQTLRMAFVPERLHFFNRDTGVAIC